MFCRPISIFKADDRGQALTELAVALPMLLFLLVGVLALADAGQKKAQVVRAAAAAARVAVVRPDLAASEAVETLKAADPRLNSGDIKTAILPADISRLPFANFIRVRVDYRYRPRTGFGWRPTFNLRSEFVVDRWVNGVLFDIK